MLQKFLIEFTVQLKNLLFDISKRYFTGLNFKGHVALYADAIIFLSNWCSTFAHLVYFVL